MPSDCGLGDPADQESSFVRREAPDVGNLDNSSGKRLDRLPCDRIPDPLLDVVNNLNAAVLSLFTDGGADQHQNRVTSILATTIQAIENSKQNYGTAPQPGDSSITSKTTNAPAERFDSFIGQLCDIVGHVDRHKPLRSYVMGMLLEGGRKSVEPMADRIEPQRVQAQHNSMHHFVSTAPWDGQRIIDFALDYAVEQFAQHGGLEAWIVDDTGIPKKGKHSVGVARQYCGVLGKTANCQVAVSVLLGSGAQTVPVAYRLYLPLQWAASPERRALAGVPSEIEFKTKWRIALDEIKRLHAEGVQPGIILADAGYGNVTEFREELSGMGLRYSVGIKPDTTLWPPGMQPLEPIPRKGRGKPTKLLRRTPEHRPVSALELSRSIRGDEW